MMNTTRTRTAVAAAALGLFALGAAACSDDTQAPTPDKGMAKDGGPDQLKPDGMMKPDGAALGTIVEVAAGNPDFSTLVAAVTKAGLVDTLKGAGPFTVFAPNNKAFTDSGITDLGAFSADDLKKILLYHVLATKALAKDVKAGAVTSAADLTIFIATPGGVELNGGNSVKGGAKVTATDVMASNGVIHVIDRVLLPPDLPTCATYGGLKELVKAVGAAAEISAGTSVLKALQGAGPFTVFAPTDAAFKALSPAPTDPALIRDVLLYHVVGAKVPSTAIPAAAGSLLKNTWGNNVTLLFSTTGGAKVNGAAVALADVKCTNGIVHVIDKVLLPPNALDMAGIAGFAELAKAVGAAAPISTGVTVADALKAKEPYTIFAPTDAAFKALSPAPTDPTVIRNVLLLHVVKAAAPVTSDKIPTTPVDSLLAGEKLSFSTTGPTVSSDGTAGAKIGPADLHVTNGVIHVIDKVLLP